jgi:hypothetical protein
MTGGLRWKLQRARSMSPSELAWRLGQRIALERWKAKAGRPAPALQAPAGGFRAAYRAASLGVGPLVTPEAFERETTARAVERADAVCAGRIELFARTYEFGGDPARWPWNRDPGGNGPEVGLRFGPTLDYRDPSRVGDARLSWELGRHGFLVPLGQAAWLTGDPRYARQAFAALEAWIDACPPYQGLQWASALEYALRAFSWGYALALLARTPAADDIADARWERVLASWAEQMRFVAAHDARHSSANNHRLGEAAGLAWSGRLLAFLPEAAAWRTRGLSVLEESLLAQTTEDGVTREHAFAYQHFVLDFAVCVHALERDAMPEPVRARIAKVAAWLERVSPGGLTWPVGDGDEGQVLPTGEPFEERVLGSLECAAGLTGAPWSGPRSARARWLGLVPRAGALTAPPPQVVAGGYVVAQRGDARMLFDVAELGLAPLYAHGHADALQVLLDVRGPRLIDPGTGGYHAQAALRERLRSTAAHDTVEVDGMSQSQPGGLFQWLRAARVFDVRAGEFEWSAAHDGYAHLGVIHRRSVRWPEPGRLVIEDRLEGQGVHRAVGRWLLGEGRIRAEARNCVAEWPDGFRLELQFELPEGGTLDEHPDADWAPRFLAPRTSRVAQVKVEGPLPLSWRTTLIWDT